MNAFPVEAPPPARRKWRPYPEYQCLGPEWPRQAPSRWRPAILRCVLSLRRGGPLPAGGMGKTGRYPVYGANRTIGSCSESNIEQRCLLVGRRDADSAVRMVAPGGWATENTWILTPNRDYLDFWYAYYLMQSVSLEGWVPGTQRTLITAEMLTDRRVGLPPLAEQRAIAVFLHEQVGKLHALSERKGRLVALLGERRRAFVRQAVTRGMDPSASLNASGDPWLGDTPAHWRVQPVWSLLHLRRGRPIGAGEVAGQDGHGLYPVYSSNHYGPLGYAKPVFDEQVSDPGTLAVTTDGPHAGTVFLPPQPFLTTNVCVSATPRSEVVEPHYYLYLLNAMLGSFVKGTVHPRIGRAEMAEIRVPVPPPAEQRVIADAIEREHRTVDETVAKLQRQMGLLEEYRSALVAAAVTGEIDVRAAAPTGG